MALKIYDLSQREVHGFDGNSTVSVVNSSSALLGANATFTGLAENIKDASVISVFCHADQPSATDGLSVEWSSDGINYDDTDKFTITPSGTKIFTFGCTSKFFRIRYTNGPTAQGTFRLQAILHFGNLKPSTHRVKDSLSDQNDAELVRAIIAGQDVGDLQFKNVGVSNARLLVSTEQPAAPPGTSPITTTADGSVSGFVDTFYTITNAKTLTIQKFGAGAAGVVGGGAKAELFYDPNANLTGMTLIAKGFMNGSNFQFDESFLAVGNGTRRIVLRRTNVGGGSLEIFARWSGFEQ